MAAFSNWIAADGATFVVGANVAGGMGAREVVPFADPADAQAFIEIYGGTALGLPDIPDTERGLHNFEVDKCIACDQCAKICPVDCITIEAEGKGKAARMTVYEIGSDYVLGSVRDEMDVQGLSLYRIGAP